MIHTEKPAQHSATSVHIVLEELTLHGNHLIPTQALGLARKVAKLLPLMVIKG